MKSSFVAVAGLAIAVAMSTAAVAQDTGTTDTPAAVTDTQSTESPTATGAETGIVGEVGGPEIPKSMASGFTPETVSTTEPFATLKVDLAASRDDVNSSLTLAQREELSGRCAVIVSHEQHYDVSAVSFCKAYTIQ